MYESGNALYYNLWVKTRELETYAKYLKYAELECRLSMISAICSNSIYLFKNVVYFHKFNMGKKKEGRENEEEKKSQGKVRY